MTDVVRGDKVTNLIPCDGKSGLLQPLDLSSRKDCAESSLLLYLSLNIFDIIITTTNICAFNFVTSTHEMPVGTGSLYIAIRYIYKIFNVCPFH